MAFRIIPGRKLLVATAGAAVISYANGCFSSGNLVSTPCEEDPSGCAEGGGGQGGGTGGSGGGTGGSGGEGTGGEVGVGGQGGMGGLGGAAGGAAGSDGGG